MSKFLFKLHTFDGEGGNAGSPSAQSSNVGEGQQNDGQQEAPDTTSRVADDKEKMRAEYAEAKDRYKDFFTEDFSKMLNGRMKNANQALDEFRQKEDSLLPLYDAFGLEDGDAQGLADAILNNPGFWAEEAAANGIDEDTYIYMKQQERERAKAERELNRLRGAQKAEETLAQWQKEAEEVKNLFPNFDLKEEVKNDRFMALLKMDNMSVLDAYKMTHVDEIIKNGMGTAAEVAEQKVLNDIRARGSRPAENGARSTGRVTVKKSPSQLSDEEFEDYKRRVMRGEHVSFD